MSSCCPQPRDHPRACGEHIRFEPVLAPPPGSSPRLRGTLDESMGPNGRVGIIPALAGNTPNPAASPASPGDHPRACGEHTDARIEDTGLAGSSPRLRGTRFAGSRVNERIGIIPALAGNTGVFTLIEWVDRDHPRACGEHLGVRHGTQLSVGSSPRLRGTRYRVLPWRPPRGIIPALAGNTT